MFYKGVLGKKKKVKKRTKARCITTVTKGITIATRPENNPYLE